MTGPLLEMAGVGRRFGRTPVLHDVDLQVAPGEFVILIGGSGSGKTTLLRIVAGLERCDAGRVALRGRTVDDPQTSAFRPPERRGLGMVFQDFALWPHMTAAENVEAACRETVAGSPRPCWNSSTSARSPTAGRCSSPAGSSSGWAWPAPSPPAPTCSCSTSPCRAST